MYTYPTPTKNLAFSNDTVTEYDIYRRESFKIKPSAEDVAKSIEPTFLDEEFDDYADYAMSFEHLLGLHGTVFYQD